VQYTSSINSVKLNVLSGIHIMQFVRRTISVQARTINYINSVLVKPQRLRVFLPSNHVAAIEAQILLTETLAQ